MIPLFYLVTSIFCPFVLGLVEEKSAFWKILFTHIYSCFL